VTKFKSDSKVTSICRRLMVGKARVRLNESEDAVLERDDETFVSMVNARDGLVFESIWPGRG
jgi:hypothetical protein